MYESFDPTLLPEMLLEIEQNWADARAAQNYEIIPYATTFKAVLDNTTARMPRLAERNRTPQVTLAWLSACAGEANYQTGQWLKGIPCDFSGWEVGTNKQTVSVKSSASTAFAVPLRLFDNLFTPEQILQISLQRAFKLVLEKWNEIAISKLSAYSGLNKYQKPMGVDGGTGPTSWKLTKIPYRNMYPQALNQYIRTASRINKFNQPVIISGGAMEVSENVDGSLEMFNFGNLRVYSDLENFTGAGLDNDFFVMSRGAMAFVNIYDYPFDGASRPPMGAEEEIYFSVTMPSVYSVNGEPIVADITRKRLKREMVLRDGLASEFTADNRCEWYDVYHVELKGEIMLNPLSCIDENVTGVLHFESDDTLDFFYSPMATSPVVNVATL